MPKYTCMICVENIDADNPLAASALFMEEMTNCDSFQVFVTEQERNDDDGDALVTVSKISLEDTSPMEVH